MTNTPFAPQLLTQVDVQEFWRTLIAPLGRHEPRLYVALIGPDHRPLPLLQEIAEIPAVMAPDQAEDLALFLRRTLTGRLDGGSVALLHCRPGPPPVTAEDRAAASTYYSALGGRGVACEVLHLGTDLDILPLPADEARALTA
ncbi:hypothetical protein [Nocardioides insulae]|uniref:hypothetical protein n=1 Tax=Nocardioides insulae TaxID=394734 RepID=UPI0004197C60|nr:hypothetical protein [Nocardioides insulae]